MSRTPHADQHYGARSLLAASKELPHQRGWSGIRQVFRVTRECTWTDRTTGERRTSRGVAYGITDLSPIQANAARMRHLHCGHWSIENGLFCIRDEASGEDHSRVRKRSEPQVLAGLRNAALNLLRPDGRKNISASLRSDTGNIQHVLNLFGIVK